MIDSTNELGIKDLRRIQEPALEFGSQDATVGSAPKLNADSSKQLVNLFLADDLAKSVEGFPVERRSQPSYVEKAALVRIPFRM